MLLSRLHASKGLHVTFFSNPCSLSSHMPDRCPAPVSHPVRPVTPDRHQLVTIPSTDRSRQVGTWHHSPHALSISLGLRCHPFCWIQTSIQVFTAMGITHSTCTPHSSRPCKKLDIGGRYTHYIRPLSFM